MRLGLAVAFALAAGAGCYAQPTLDPTTCEIRCVDTCPGDLTCNGAGYCIAVGQTCGPRPPASGFVHVSAGDVFACGLDGSGSLYCWGDNAHHEISPSTITLSYPEPTLVNTDHWDAIATGGAHACGLQAGVLKCWGKNSEHEVAPLGADVSEPTVVALPTGQTTWLAVSASLFDTCAIATADPSATSGTLYCWGSSAGVNASSPTAVKGVVTDWTKVTTGQVTTCAISASQGLFCWGDNSVHQLADFTGPTTSTPYAISLPDTPTSVGAGANMTCATTANGSLYCWGDNTENELGAATGALSITPVLASNDLGWTQVSSSFRHSCGLLNDQVVCWGQAFNGGMGDGYWYQQNALTTVIQSGATEVSLGTGNDQPFLYGSERIAGFGNDKLDLDLSCAIVGGVPNCWGDNRYGQLGLGTPATSSPTAVEVVGDHLFSALAVGGDHACAIGDDQLLYCWGSTISGQADAMPTGIGTACSPDAPCNVATPTSISFMRDVISVSAGESHTCAIGLGSSGSSELDCWGASGHLQLGAGNVSEHHVPVLGGQPFSTLYSTGDDTSCALNATGVLACWGHFEGVDQTPAPDSGPLNGMPSAIAFSDGNGHPYGCALLGSDLECWGDNSAGEFGEGNMTSNAQFTNTGLEYSAFAVGNNAQFMCGIGATTIECSGIDDRGQLGTGFQDTSFSADSPQAVTGPTGCTQLAAGQEHVCAACGETVYCWGANELGELGEGLISPTVEGPTAGIAAPAGDPWVQIAAGDSFTCARTQAGHVYCWGMSKYGGLGNGGMATNLPTPVAAPM